MKRALDRRPVLLLARGGKGVDHTTAAANAAALVEVVAARPGSRVLNAADPDAPSALEIARTIARLLGHAWEEVPLGDGAPDDLGRTPWDALHPIILDTTAARELGYVPAGDYSTTVDDEVEWLVEAARGGEDVALLPQADDPFFALFLDYAAEDRYLARRVPA